MSTLLALSLGNAALELVLLWRLLAFRLQYRWFAAFLCASIGQSLLLAVPLNSQVYLRLWIASEPILLVLQYLTVRETISRIQRSYPGGMRFCQSVTAAACAVAVCLCVISIVPDVTALNLQPALQSLPWLFGRAVTSILALSMVGVMACAARCPSNRAPNLGRHARLLTAYLLVSAAAYFALDLRLAPTAVISTVLLSLYCVLFALWLGLTRAGEVPPTLTPVTEEMADSWERLLAIRDTLRESVTAVWR